MNASPALIEFLKAWEGPPHFSPQRDPVSPGTWDIGYGHVCPWNSPNISPAEAVRLLAADVDRFSVCVQDLVTADLDQQEFDAALSLTFNIGRTAFEGSTLLRLLNLGETGRAAEQFARWNKAGGKVVHGLVKRRAAERAIFDAGDYSLRP